MDTITEEIEIYAKQIMTDEYVSAQLQGAEFSFRVSLIALAVILFTVLVIIYCIKNYDTEHLFICLMPLVLVGLMYIFLSVELAYQKYLWQNDPLSMTENVIVKSIDSY